MHRDESNRFAVRIAHRADLPGRIKRFTGFAVIECFQTHGLAARELLSHYIKRDTLGARALQNARRRGEHFGLGITGHGAKCRIDEGDARARLVQLAIGNHDGLAGFAKRGFVEAAAGFELAATGDVPGDTAETLEPTGIVKKWSGADGQHDGATIAVNHIEFKIDNAFASGKSRFYRRCMHGLIRCRVRG